MCQSNFLHDSTLTCIFPGKFLWDWINDLNCVYDYPIAKSNKKHRSLKRRGNPGNIREFPGNTKLS